VEAVACSELRSELWSHSAPARGAPAVNARCATVRPFPPKGCAKTVSETRAVTRSSTNRLVVHYCGATNTSFPHEGSLGLLV